MALEDLLGRTYEIRIIDFLATNYDNSYNQSEISDFTGISRNVLYKKLPEMVEKKLLEVDNSVGRFKSYRLANNSIVNKIIAIDIEHNLLMSETDGTSAMDMAATEGPGEPMENRYYQAPEVNGDASQGHLIPIFFQVSDTDTPDGFISLSENGMKKLFLSLKGSTVVTDDNQQAQTSSR